MIPSLLDFHIWDCGDGVCSNTIEDHASTVKVTETQFRPLACKKIAQLYKELFKS